MKNIFSQTKEYVQQPNRNVFDLSFQNNGTYNFGTLYPVFCKEVIPGDSFQIDTQFALRFLPMAFPIQTRMRANLHFFYVRNRNLWDDWKKFIGHTHDTEFPYLDGSQDSIKTGGLGDYFGIPTTLVGNYSRVDSLNFPSFTRFYSSRYYGYYYPSSNVSLSYGAAFDGSSLQSKFGAPSVNVSPDNYTTAFIANRSFRGKFGGYIDIELETPLDSTVSTETIIYFGSVKEDGSFFPLVAVDTDFAYNYEQ